MNRSLAGAPLFISKTPAALMNENSALAVVDAIEALCLQHGAPCLIVIDTLARNLGSGDENSNADIGVFINHIDNMRAKLGCAVLIVHHSGHSATDRARGASSLHAAMDTVFRLDKSGDGIMMTHIKSKESELNPPLSLALEQVTLLGWLDANGDEMNSAVIVAGVAEAGSVRVRLTPQQELVLSVFRDAAKAHGQLSEDGKLAGLHVETWRREYYSRFPDKEADTDTKKTAFGRARKRLVEVGRLAVVGDIYHFTGIACFIDNSEIVEAIRARDTTGTRD